MKKFLVIKTLKLNRLSILSTWNIFPALLLGLLLSGFITTAQTLPVVTVRFNNPQFDCPTQTYCLDVEFQADGPNDTLFGMNVRFFYDDVILEYLGMSDFAPGYGAPTPRKFRPVPACTGDLPARPNGSTATCSSGTANHRCASRWWMDKAIQNLLPCG